MMKMQLGATAQNPSPRQIFQCALVAMALALFSSGALAQQINLNTADAEALQYIPGIGPGKSLDIIRLRSERGGFKAVEELLDVPGIGEKTLIEIRKHGVLQGGVSTLNEEMKNNPPGEGVSATSSTAEDPDPGSQG